MAKIKNKEVVAKAIKQENDQFLDEIRVVENTSKPKEKLVLPNSVLMQYMQLPTPIVMKLDANGKSIEKEEMKYICYIRGNLHSYWRTLAEAQNYAENYNLGRV